MGSGDSEIGYIDPDSWKDREGNIIAIVDMEDSYLYNVIKYQRKKVFRKLRIRRQCEPEQITLVQVDDYLRKNSPTWQSLYIEARLRKVLPEDFGDNLLDYVVAGR